MGRLLGCVGHSRSTAWKRVQVDPWGLYLFSKSPSPSLLPCIRHQQFSCLCFQSRSSKAATPPGSNATLWLWISGWPLSTALLLPQAPLLTSSQKDRPFEVGGRQTMPTSAGHSWWLQRTSQSERSSFLPPWTSVFLILLSSFSLSLRA